MSIDSSPAARQRTSYTIPGLAQGVADDLVALLQERLHALNDLALTLKHIHWNVVGTHFIAVHTMIDPQVDAVREMVDDTAERIAALGGSPIGTPGALAAGRSWDDYSLGRATALEHRAALDLVNSGVIESHRKAIEATDEPDPVSQDMLIGQSRQLEQFQWFVRAHLESADGRLTTSGAQTELQAAGTAPADSVQDAVAAPENSMEGASA
jgi:starvation-inducible DNA-binding protein